MGIRTTVVLDEDVLERVRDRAKSEGVPFKTKLNDLVREGLANASKATSSKFVVKTFDMGESALPFPLKVSDLDAMEDDARIRRPE